MARRKGASDKLVLGAKIVVAVFLLGIVLNTLITPHVVESGFGLAWLAPMSTALWIAGLVGIVLLALGLWEMR